MTKQNTLDPLALWKSMYEQTESHFSEAIHETLKTDEYAEMLGQVQNSFLQYQQLVRSTTDMYLKQINVPTNEEMSSVASLIVNLEEKVDSIDEKIEDELSSKEVSLEITKLKVSVSKLDKKMNQVLQASDQLDKNMHQILEVLTSNKKETPAETTSSQPKDKK
ncbi:polyhydroxyalkanoate biosynthesis repressor PhaR [Salipaludibacillus sp. CUR1]|uniref:poly(R)-hydroxyalkanoic acid synthase subunit PhaE n=1 Tax=Salipaludibacillus sp. CUR1 TaxID=2820003 RepID=UPI001E4C3CC0|nr:poly(R)-hydroxyalkanoic acid synthase subunit PhaE [Salipaludibacillus sp. CUR1]MCE7793065.1 polyhydroxyalkanoate biosynthesis repressor PhaR [Salipaludibacillus sp. CUR1]